MQCYWRLFLLISPFHQCLLICRCHPCHHQICAHPSHGATALPMPPPSHDMTLQHRRDVHSYTLLALHPCSAPHTCEQHLIHEHDARRPLIITHPLTHPRLLSTHRPARIRAMGRKLCRRLLLCVAEQHWWRRRRAGSAAGDRGCRCRGQAGCAGAAAAAAGWGARALRDGVVAHERSDEAKPVSGMPGFRVQRSNVGSGGPRLRRQISTCL